MDVYERSSRGTSDAAPIGNNYFETKDKPRSWVEKSVEEGGRTGRGRRWRWLSSFALQGLFPQHRDVRIERKRGKCNEKGRKWQSEDGGNLPRVSGECPLSPSFSLFLALCGLMRERHDEDIRTGCTRKLGEETFPWESERWEGKRDDERLAFGCCSLSTLAFHPPRYLFMNMGHSKPTIHLKEYQHSAADWSSQFESTYSHPLFLEPQTMNYNVANTIFS